MFVYLLGTLYLEKLRKIIVVLIVLLNISCFVQKGVEKEPNSFTPEQINELKKISTFFNSQICNKELIDFGTCIQSKLPEINQGYYEFFYDNIEFEKQEKLFDSISKETFNEIWSYCEVTNAKSLNTYQSLCARGFNSKYLNFLKQVGKTNEYIKRYAKNVEAAGDFGHSIFFIDTFLNNVTKSKLNNEDIQIIISIHILTSNYQKHKFDQSQ